MVLLGWPCGCCHHVSLGPSLEGSEPSLLAGGLWSDEPGPTSYWSQFLFLVGDQRDLQRVDTTSQACVVVEIQYAKASYVPRTYVEPETSLIIF